MTYQTTTAPSSIAHSLHAVLNRVTSFIGRIGLALMANSTAQRRVEHIRLLQSKSDEELAKMKINREDIVHEVFKDLYYV